MTSPTVLAAQLVTNTGTAITFTAADVDGNTAVTGNDVFLLVNNGDAASHVVTVVTPGTEEGLAIADRTVTVAAGAMAMIPLGPIYRDTASGLATATYDAVTSITVALVRV